MEYHLPAARLSHQKSRSARTLPSVTSATLLANPKKISTRSFVDAFVDTFRKQGKILLFQNNKQLEYLHDKESQA
jgi:hypothetical protein